MSKGKTTRLLKKDGKAFRFSSDAFKTFIDMKKPILDDIKGHKKQVPDAAVLKDIEQKKGIPYDTLKKWKTGDNGPADITLVEYIADYFDVDCLDLLIPVKEEVSPKMTTREKELISYVYAQLIDLEDVLRQRCVPSNWTEEEKRNFWKDCDCKIKSKSEEIIKQIDKSSIDVSKMIRNKLYRLVYEITNDNDSRIYDISGQRIVDPISGQYWDQTDRNELFDCAADDVWWLVNMENEWLDNMGIDTYKPIDDEHYELVDKYYLAQSSGEDLSEIRCQIEEYGAGNIFNEYPITPRELIRHDFCEGLLMVFKHDFPELEDIE